MLPNLFTVVHVDILHIQAQPILKIQPPLPKNKIDYAYKVAYPNKIVLEIQSF